MENILSIDATVEPAVAQVVQLRAGKLHVLETRRVALGLAALEELHDESAAPAPAAEPIQAPAEDTPPEESAADKVARALQQCGDSVRTLLSSLSNAWTSSILIVPARNYLSLNVDLPFSDARNVNKVLNLEVQDLVPFDVADFLIEHHALGKHAERHDIHVSIIPAMYVKRILGGCRLGGFEPVIVSTPASTLAAAYVLSPASFSENSAVLYCRDPYFYMALRVGGSVRADRIFHREHYPEEQSGGSALKESLLTEFRLTIGEAEERYQQPISEVYAFGNTFSPDELSAGLARNVISSNFSQFLDEQSPAGSGELAALGAVFAQDTAPAPILTNFRTREFTYRPQLSELFAGLKRLAPYIACVAVLSIIWLGASYVLRQRSLTRLRAAIRTQISTAIPEITLNDGEEIDALQHEREQLQHQLDALGSQSSLTPLDVLAQLSKDLQPGQATFKNISIKGNRIDIDGSAPDYKSIYAIESLFKAKKGSHGQKDIYCKPKLNTSNAMSRSGAARDFSFTVYLCD